MAHMDDGGAGIPGAGQQLRRFRHRGIDTGQHQFAVDIFVLDIDQDQRRYTEARRR